MFHKILINIRKTGAGKIALSSAAVLLCLAAGYGAGSFAGAALIENYITGNSGLLLLLSRPGFDYVNTARMLNSDSSLSRLAGYYSLLDNRKIDSDFFIERYRREEATFQKRTIIWLLGFSDDRDQVLRFLSSEYSSAGVNIKREILRSMKKLHPGFFKTFVKDRGIEEKFADSI